MIVVDASAAIEWLLQSRAGERIDARLFSRRMTIAAPHLIDLEIAQAFRRLVAARAMTADRGEEALQDLIDLPLVRYPHDVLLPRIWHLRGGLTAYDAAYLALAEALDAPLLTCDARLKSASGHRARVEVV